ncbi:MAG: MFS transporter [Actinobacteria bacterium]|nr:MFS transporter [Actinomycetota bacterium]
MLQCCQLDAYGNKQVYGNCNYKFEPVFTFFTVGAVTGQLTSVIYNRKFKKIQIILIGYLIVIPATIAISFISNIILFYILYLISGYLLGVIWIQANQFVLENKVKNKDRIVTILLSFYPIGAIVSPFISSKIIRMNLNWRFAYYIVVFLIVLNMILYILILARRKEGSKNDSNSKLGFKEIFTDKTKNIIFILALLSIAFYCASETVVATWAPTFFRISRNLDIRSAGYALTLFWSFIIIGRGITLFIAGRIKAIKIILVISILAIISMAVVVFLHSQNLIYVFIAAAGLGYSAIFPLIISTGSTLYDRGRGLLATGLFVGANTGIAIAPFLTKFSSSVSMIFSLSLSFILMIFVSLIILSIQRIISRKKISL